LIGNIKELIKNTIYKIESKSDFNIIELESVFSVGEASPETIRNYITNQG
jgi:REP element-mobilizing transposase RayT